MSTHNICFCREIRQIWILSGGKKAPYQELCLFNVDFQVCFEVIHFYSLTAICGFSLNLFHLM